MAANILISSIFSLNCENANTNKIHTKNKNIHIFL